MINYFNIFPEKSQTELRTITIFGNPNGDDLPDGTYIFTEYFCTDLNCNCNRVLIKVLQDKLDNEDVEEVATISYSWAEDHDSASNFDRELENPFLDPFHFQAHYAETLMEMWYDQLQSDHNYKARLRRHYEELREECGEYEESDAFTSIRQSRRDRKRKKSPRQMVAISKADRKSRAKALLALKKKKRK
jgi:hypothetical protein